MWLAESQTFEDALRGFCDRRNQGLVAMNLEVPGTLAWQFADCVLVGVFGARLAILRATLKESVLPFSS